MLQAPLEGNAERQALAALAWRGAKKNFPQLIASLTGEVMLKEVRAISEAPEKTRSPAQLGASQLE